MVAKAVFFIALNTYFMRRRVIYINIILINFLYLRNIYLMILI